MNDHSIHVQTGPLKRDCEVFGLLDKKVVGTTVALRNMLGMTGAEAHAYCVTQGWPMKRLGGEV